MDPRHQAFSDHFLLSFNATEAAKAVGYSPKTATQIGYQLLRREDVQQYLAERRAAVSASAGVTLERVVTELARVALSDMRDAISWGTRPVNIGNGVEIEMAYAEPKDSASLSPDVSAAVAEVSQGKTGFKLKMHSKTAALDMLMKHLGGYERDNEQKADGITRLIEAAQGAALPLGRKQESKA